MMHRALVLLLLAVPTRITAPARPERMIAHSMALPQETDAQRVARQEEQLQFDRFDMTTAWTLGSAIRALAESRHQNVAIDIELNGHPLFFSAMPGTTPDNIDWMRRKKNTVNRFRRSSYAVALDMQAQKTTLMDRQALPLRDFVSVGGCFPIRIRGTGMVGTIAVSGLPDRSDHELIVEALAKQLGQSYESLALEKPPAPPAK
jgi:uncharacterized protein (UPF0303 family)